MNKSIVAIGIFLIIVGIIGIGMGGTAIYMMSKEISLGILGGLQYILLYLLILLPLAIIFSGIALFKIGRDTKNSE